MRKHAFSFFFLFFILLDHNPQVRPLVMDLFGTVSESYWPILAPVEDSWLRACLVLFLWPLDLSWLLRRPSGCEFAWWPSLSRYFRGSWPCMGISWKGCSSRSIASISLQRVSILRWIGSKKGWEGLSWEERRGYGSGGALTWGWAAVA